MFISSDLGYFLEYFEFLECDIMFELSVVYFSSIEIDLDIERIVDKNLIVLFIINFEKSTSQDGIGFFNIFKSGFELSSS